MWWFNGICAKGMQKPLEVSDLYSLNPDDQSAILVPKWNKLWSESMTGGFLSYTYKKIRWSDYHKRQTEALSRPINHRVASQDRIPLLQNGTTEVISEIEFTL